MIQFVALVSVAVFVLFHLFGGKLRLLARAPRSIWLSGAGGVSVACVVMHLLPELAEGRFSAFAAGAAAYSALLLAL